MARNNKNDDKGKDSQIRRGHPDQETAEREEEKTQQQVKESPGTGESPGIPDKDTEGENVSEPKDKGFPIIGIGASAGGLEALEKFLSQIPEESGMALVIISHTDPNQVTMLPDILKRKSKIPVMIIENGTKPEPNKAYLPASDKDVVIKDRVFHTTERQRKEGCLKENLSQTRLFQV